MTPHFVSLFTRPERAWDDIRQDEKSNGLHYLGHLLLLALIPAVSLYVGTTYTGWSLVKNEDVHLQNTSALQLCVLLYFAILIGVLIMGAFVRWMTRTFDARPSLNECIGFIAYVSTPFYIAGLAALYPSRWLAIAILGAASVYSAFLLYVGLPRFMRIPHQKGALFSTSVLAVGLLVLVNMMVGTIHFWQLSMSPEYERTTQDQSYPTVDERPQKVPEAL
ncbi:Yip1 family protein [Pseudomonas sp. RIT-PI-AD]|uniref:Yip1 family protein n=1 Tax=Pseudomonas sp. RIT-PI-AD TaxID=3035294 RepID=UPI0021DB5798|nr:Yip1 family protein [Pseudomonas sp. RIT-PI-AD]